MSKQATVAEIGEFGLIDRIQHILPTAKHNDLILGIGDDTAIIRLDSKRVMFVTCDIQVENQHFRLENTTTYQLGRRAMAVNLSDIAAMGGNPTFALISLGFPRTILLEDFDSLFAGMKDELSEFDVAVIGGNLSHSESGLIIDITLMGEAAQSEYLTRSGAQPGDKIFVTGNLGNSGAGFQVLQKFGTKFPQQYERFVNAHLQPKARVAFGQKLAHSKLATAMIDVSDGIASDLNHICEMSKVGAEIRQSKLPADHELHSIIEFSGKNFTELTMHSGEDYELLFTVKPDTALQKLQSISVETGIPVTEIGTILPKGSGYYLINEKNQKQKIQPSGWDHFREK